MYEGQPPQKKQKIENAETADEIKEDPAPAEIFQIFDNAIEEDNEELISDFIQRYPDFFGNIVSDMISTEDISDPKLFIDITEHDKIFEYLFHRMIEICSSTFCNDQLNRFTDDDYNLDDREDETSPLQFILDRLDYAHQNNKKNRIQFILSWVVKNKEKLSLFLETSESFSSLSFYKNFKLLDFAQFVRHTEAISWLSDPQNIHSGAETIDEQRDYVFDFYFPKVMRKIIEKLQENPSEASSPLQYISDRLEYAFKEQNLSRVKFILAYVENIEYLMLREIIMAIQTAKRLFSYPAYEYFHFLHHPDLSPEEKNTLKWIKQCTCPTLKVENDNQEISVNEPNLASNNNNSRRVGRHYWHDSPLYSPPQQPSSNFPDSLSNNTGFGMCQGK